MSGPAPSLRVLGRLRLSRHTDESTSIERQIEIIQQWADAGGHRVVAWAEDIDVSRDVDPFDTPGLGVWFGPEKSDEWDIVATWKLDRLATGSIYLNKVIDWCNKHGKSLVSVTESFDLSTWVGRMVANVIAGLAEGELEAIKERTEDSRRKLRTAARWGGGKPPFGYVLEKKTDGNGWGLAIDPVAYPLVRRIVETVLEGGSYTALAADLNAEGVLTPAEYHRAQQAGVATTRRAELPEELQKPPVDPPGKRRQRKRHWPPSWHQTPIRNMITNPALRGLVHHERDILRDATGLPMQFGKPLVTRDEWERLQAEVTRRRDERRAVRQKKLSPLAGVVHCLTCGLTLHHTRKVASGIMYRYYRCENKHTVAIPSVHLESIVEESVLTVVGGIQIMERIWIPGDSRDEDLQEAIAGVDALAVSLGRAKSATARERIQSQIDALDGRIAQLEATPSREAHWEYRPTGGTYAERWRASNEDERRDLLKRSGITAHALFTKEPGTSVGKLTYEVRIPSELKANLGHPADESAAEPWQKIGPAVMFIPSVRRSVVPEEDRVEV